MSAGTGSRGNTGIASLTGRGRARGTAIPAAAPRLPYDGLTTTRGNSARRRWVMVPAAPVAWGYSCIDIPPPGGGDRSPVETR